MFIIRKDSKIGYYIRFRGVPELWVDSREAAARVLSREWLFITT